MKDPHYVKEGFHEVFLYYIEEGLFHKVFFYYIEEGLYEGFLPYMKEASYVLRVIFYYIQMSLLATLFYYAEEDFHEVVYCIKDYSAMILWYLLCRSH